MKSFVLAALLGLTINTAEAVHIEQMVSMTEDPTPSAADEYDAEVKKDADKKAKDEKEEKVKEEKKLAEKKVDEEKAELKKAEKSLREEEEAAAADKAKKVAQDAALNDALNGAKFAGKASKEFDSIMKASYTRDMASTKKEPVVDKEKVAAIEKKW
jgi:membrane protein involved in colicin uptake